MKWALITLGLILGLLVWRLVMASAGRLPRAGSPAPDFSLPDHEGRTRRLGDFAGRCLVLYFFPRADTPG